MADTVVLVGTRKGLITARSNEQRRDWKLKGIEFVNKEVYAVGVDPRHHPPRLFAGGGSGHWGPLLYYSDDLGATWTEPERPPAFPEEAGAAVTRIWQIQAAGDDRPGVVYAGVEPHALFRSDDGGRSFSLVQGLWDHPHRPQWQPGGGGACLHTILTHPDDPRRLLVAMSAAGVYRSTDEGATWQPANAGIQAYWLPEDQRFPEFGQCVHKVAMHPSRPDRLFAQNHFGVYRSDDGGDSWMPIEDGLPSTFGFPFVVHPREPDTVYVFPLRADAERVPPGDRCRVYRSRDAGVTWQVLSAGLPEGPYYGAVLRDAMCSDGGNPAGIYVGTRLGEVFASLDGGDSWTTLASHLPDVLAIRAAVVG